MHSKMLAPSILASAELHLNPQLRTDIYGPAERAILSQARSREASAVISHWPGYAVTPLVDLASLATRIGIAGLCLKDESGRLGLGSFKALGGAYAVYCFFADAIAAKTGERPAPEAMLGGAFADLMRGATVCCATDGNHGRSVAWGARLLGCACVIYVHETVSIARVEAIEAYGATVVRNPGNYDDAVRAAAAESERRGWIVVSDTSYPGYTDIPRNVMQGYTVMVNEAIDQFVATAAEAPTHVFIQGGVGGVAAAVASVFWERFGVERPLLVVVEPDRAACLIASARAGRIVAVEGALDTIMAGLACGEPSLLAWQILAHGADAFMAVEDDAAVVAMRLLASGDAGPAVVSGESGAAGLAGLLAAVERPEFRAALKLDASSRVLLFNTEGDTDAALYREIVGRTGDEVRRAA